MIKVWMEMFFDISANGISVSYLQRKPHTLHVLKRFCSSLTFKHNGAGHFCSSLLKSEIMTNFIHWSSFHTEKRSIFISSVRYSSKKLVGKKSVSLTFTYFYFTFMIESKASTTSKIICFFKSLLQKKKKRNRR